MTDRQFTTLLIAQLLPMTDSSLTLAARTEHASAIARDLVKKVWAGYAEVEAESK